MNFRKDNLKTLRWLYRSIKGGRYIIVLLIALSGFLSVISLEYALLFRSLIDYAVTKDMGGLFRSALLVIIAAIIQITCRALYRYLEEFGKSKIENNLKKNGYMYI